MSKLIRTIITGLMLSVSMGTMASEGTSLSIPPMSIKPGDTGTLYVEMKNDVDICSFQFNIKLPDGLEVVKELNEDDEIVEAISLTDRKKSSHQLNFKRTEDGGYFILAFSLNNAAFRGSSGNVLSIKVKANENMNNGNHNIAINNILLVSPDEQRYQPQDYTGIITVGDATTNPTDPNNPTDPTTDGCSLSIHAQTIPAGVSSVITIDLNNSDEVTAFQFDLELPQGFTIDTIMNDDDEEIPNIQLTERKKSKHQLTCAQQENGVYKVVVLSMSNQAFRGNNGAIVNIGLSVPSSVTSGSYPIKLSNIHIVPLKDGVQGERIDQPDVTGYITVTNASENDDVEAKLAFSTLRLEAGKSNQPLNIALTNNIDITAFQMDVKLPEGIAVNSAQSIFSGDTLRSVCYSFYNCNDY